MGRIFIIKVRLRIITHLVCRSLYLARQSSYWIDPSHKSHNALGTYPTMHQFVTECAHFCYKMVHCGIWEWCIVEFVQQVYCVPVLYHHILVPILCWNSVHSTCHLVIRLPVKQQALWRHCWGLKPLNNFLKTPVFFHSRFPLFIMLSPPFALSSSRWLDVDRSSGNTSFLFRVPGSLFLTEINDSVGYFCCGKLFLVLNLLSFHLMESICICKSFKT